MISPAHLIAVTAWHRHFSATSVFVHNKCALLPLQVFAPAFRRNSRWSVDPKVPDVGDESSSWEDVSAFYDFWYSFKSWREFPHPGGV